MSRVLSVQSHVAFGYVGGKAAVFPLQCLGYDVDVVNTVNFSNHSGYGRFGGSKADAEELTRIFGLMAQNGLLRSERLLTGYIPSGEALAAVKDMATKLREANPELIYLLDPVLGDAGQLYVAPSVIPVYRAMLPLSTIITPNWFEVEVLTDVKIENMSTLRKALKILHDEHKVPNIVMSSIPLKPWLKAALPSRSRTPPGSEPSDEDFLLCISSSQNQTGDDAPSIVHAGRVPYISGYFSGVGDLFSAFVVAHYKPTSPILQTNSKPLDTASGETALSRAVSAALTKTHAMLLLTNEYAQQLPEEERQPTDDEADEKEADRRVRRMKGRELRLIQGQDIIRGTQKATERRMDLWAGFWTS
ncbi:putative pyridoxal kinase [Steccherinum ochraceum]|uniref:pyridoxal kinase n=1 Tax=Steccherinum ochraceum TaxID=92696 RepID=A0A4R0S041_9APHY|nr:putative pyridoxal kinase [Steccherinum ochraceum]